MEVVTLKKTVFLTHIPVLLCAEKILLEITGGKRERKAYVGLSNTGSLFHISDKEL